MTLEESDSVPVVRSAISGENRIIATFFLTPRGTLHVPSLRAVTAGKLAPSQSERVASYWEIQAHPETGRSDVRDDCRN